MQAALGSFASLRMTRRMNAIVRSITAIAHSPVQTAPPRVSRAFPRAAATISTALCTTVLKSWTHTALGYEFASNFAMTARPTPPPGSETGVTRRRLQQLYELMLRAAQHAGGPVAVEAPLVASLRRGDVIISAHRSAALDLARGAPLRARYAPAAGIRSAAELMFATGAARLAHRRLVLALASADVPAADWLRILRYAGKRRLPIVYAAEIT